MSTAAVTKGFMTHLSKKDRSPFKNWMWSYLLTLILLCNKWNISNFRWQFAGQEVLIWTNGGKIQIWSQIVTPICECPLWRRSHHSSVRILTVSYTLKLLVYYLFIVTHWNYLFTPPRVRHLRWTQLTTYYNWSMWSSANVLAAWWTE